VRTLLFTIAAAAVLSTIGLISPAAHAQNPAGINASKHGIAVVDISYIFKKHARFRDTMESMKKEMDSVETTLKADRDEIAGKEKQRDAYNVGSAEYKRIDEEVARMMAEFNLKMTKLRKDFLDREAKTYYQTYVEISDAVSYYAKHHDIGLVIRFNGEPVDPNRREEVLKEINKEVVFQNQVDITPDVLALLNRNPQTATPGAQPASQLPPR
jgi:Skp family chaperone for outer membrane proteins